MARTRRTETPLPLAAHSLMVSANACSVTPLILSGSNIAWHSDRITAQLTMQSIAVSTTLNHNTLCQNRVSDPAHAQTGTRRSDRQFNHADHHQHDVHPVQLPTPTLRLVTTRPASTSIHLLHRVNVVEAAVLRQNVETFDLNLSPDEARFERAKPGQAETRKADSNLVAEVGAGTEAKQLDRHLQRKHADERQICSLDPVVESASQFHMLKRVIVRPDSQSGFHSAGGS